ncbi:MAG: hypothetical protein F4Y03_02410 [Alphaproteobacteria bacterium]|nr:hypothetical protein [Alphaproteobacteria bacterium]
MRFLLDVCAASRSLHAALAELGHDVLSVRDWDPRATDRSVLAFAYEDRRALITEDKDFGELVFLLRQPHPCIVRLVEMRAAEKASAMRELITHYSDMMTEGAMIVVSRDRVRIRFERGNGQDAIRSG